MKEILEQINKVFENRIRLAIMSALMVNATIDFLSLKKLLGASDGNIASNIAVLEELRYVKVRKRIIGKKTNTSYSITPAGRQAFVDHLNALERLIHGLSQGRGE